jgi:hypothetical protein
MTETKVRKREPVSTSFKPGHKGLKAKGTKHHKTKVLEKVGLTSWEKFGEWLTTKGVEDYMEAMNQLGPRDKIVAFNAIIEYYKPKLTRSQVDVNANVVIENISFE